MLKTIFGLTFSSLKKTNRSRIRFFSKALGASLCFGQTETLLCEAIYPAGLINNYNTII